VSRELVVVVLISDWIKLYSGYNSIELQISGLEQYYDGFNTISRYTTRDDNDNEMLLEQAGQL
jgi:hypothetical protein